MATAEILSVDVGVTARRRHVSAGATVDVVQITSSLPSSSSSSSSSLPVTATSRCADVPSVNLQFKDISYIVPLGRRKGEKAILKSVSGQFCSKQLVAIMGASGAGKTTLMNVLAAYRRKWVSGTILVNGRQRDVDKFRQMSSYIMQDDALLPHLSVLEALNYATSLKLAAGHALSAHKRHALVDDVLNTLGISEVRHTRTSKLSGGQRKRLSIAVELVNNPPILFCDEPTSGLDSSSCYQCLSLLKSLAQAGRLIVCTVHQPSAKLFELFDQLYIVADGECVYDGSVRRLVPYLSKFGLVCPPYHNPADYVIEVSVGDRVQELVAATRSRWQDDTSCRCHCTDVDNVLTHDDMLTFVVNLDIKETDIIGTRLCAKCLKHIDDVTDRLDAAAARSSCDDDVIADAVNGDSQWQKKTSLMSQLTTFMTQFRLLLSRSFLCILRDVSLTHLRLASHVLCGVLIGLLYLDIGNDATKAFDNAGCLFFGLLFLMYTALMPTVLTFPVELSVFLREHLNCWYSVVSYYFAKTTADLPFQVVFPVMYGSIVYWMTGQPNDSFRFVMYLVLSTMTSLVAQSLGLLIGAATSLQVAVFLGPVTSIPILVFSGFFVSFNTMPSYLRWLSYITYVRYSFEGILQVMYGFSRPALDCSYSSNTSVTEHSYSAIVPDKCIFSDSAVLLRQLDVDDADVYVDIALLFLFFVVFRVACFLVLLWRAVRKY